MYRQFYKSIQPKQRKQDIPIKSLMLMYYSFYVIIIANLFAPKRPLHFVIFETWKYKSSLGREINGTFFPSHNIHEKISRRFSLLVEKSSNSFPYTFDLHLILVHQPVTRRGYQVHGGTKTVEDDGGSGVSLIWAPRLPLPIFRETASQSSIN